jgi:hypothetical protein
MNGMEKIVAKDSIKKNPNHVMMVEN